MKVKVLGSGSLNSKYRDNSCYAITDKENNTYLIDFPYQYSKNFVRNEIDKKNVRGVLLTHIHPDHLGNICSFLYEKYYSPGKKLEILGHQKVLVDFVNILESSKMKPSEDYARIKQIEIYEPATRGDLEFYIRRNIHQEAQRNIFTTAVKIKDRRTGKSIGISSDCCYDEKLFEKYLKEGKITEEERELLSGFLWDSDVIIHDVDLSDYDYSHTNIKEIEKKLDEYPDKKIYGTHISNGLEESGYNGRLEFLRDGQEIEL